MQVLTVGRERRSPGADAVGHHVQRVEDRQTKHQHRYQWADGGIAPLDQQQAEYRNTETEKLAAGVPHEHAGRKGVVA